VKLGVVQGRLLKPINNTIQSFPYQNWKEELSLLESINLLGVEWLITSEVYENNPIFDEDFNYFDSIISVCLDNLITESIHHKDFVSNIFEKVCSVKDIKNINIPILEESSMENADNRKKFIDILKKYSKKFPEKKFMFEAELKLNSYLEIVDSNNNFFVTYDTGNLTSYGANHSEYILQFKNKIKYVHIKDKTHNGVSKELFSGDTDFEEIIYSLKKIGFDGYFILQLARGETGNEFETIKNQIKQLKALYDKC
jgi:hypothetical protein